MISSLAELTDTDCRKVLKSYRQDPIGFQTEVLDVKPKNVWPKMVEVAESVRDNPFTAIKAGHSVGKTYEVARLAVWFLYCFSPSSVITTAPSYPQVRDLLWREIRETHTNAKFPLGGKPTEAKIDLQALTGDKWFALGFSTRRDTVTQEATRFQGYHNKHILVVFDEAAGILPEIWRAAQHLLTSGFIRFVAIGNMTSATGDFANCFSDPKFNKITISVKDTPNFKAGKELIPGVSGREYEERMRLKYGIDHDQYRIRIEGGFPMAGAEGAYYGKVMHWLKEHQRITKVDYNGSMPVYTVWDPGYTTAIWFFQPRGLDIAFIRCYEDSGLGIEDYAKILRRYEKDYGYQYGSHFAPFDIGTNVYRAAHGESLLEIARRYGIDFKVLEPERAIIDGIERTRQFLYRCWFDRDNCKVGIEALRDYSERKNVRMSTEERPVFAGTPEFGWSRHLADGMRYASKSLHLLPSGDNQEKKQKYQKLTEMYRSPFDV